MAAGYVGVFRGCEFVWAGAFAELEYVGDWASEEPADEYGRSSRVGLIYLGKPTTLDCRIEVFVEKGWN